MKRKIEEKQTAQFLLDHAENNVSAECNFLRPVRIQRKRSKGWKMPENTVSVCRPTKWGNPFKLVGDMIYIDASHRGEMLDKWVYVCQGDIQKVIKLYKSLLSQSDNFQNEPNIEHWLYHFLNLNFSELKGKNLACFCHIDNPCHADVLLDIVNRE